MKFFTLATERGISLYLLDLNGGVDDVSGNRIARLFLTVVSAFAERPGGRTATTPSAGADRLRCVASGWSCCRSPACGRRWSEARTRAASRGVLGCAAPSGAGASTSAGCFSQTGWRLLFTVTIAGASITTAFRFRGGRLLQQV